MVTTIHDQKMQVKIILTKQGKNLIKQIEYKMNKTNKSKNTTYSFYEDVITRSTKEHTKKTKQKYLITKSYCPKEIIVGELKDNYAVLRTDGKIDAIYYTKKILNFPELFIKDQRDNKSRLLEIGQLQDAEKQNQFIKTPNYLAQIIDKKKKRTITVSEKITNAITIDRFYKQANLTQRNKIIKKIDKIYTKLIINDLFPSQNKVDQIWVNKKNLDLTITDSTIGPTPSYRNKLSLLTVIKNDENFPKPNWDLIEKNFVNLKKYWKSLTKNQRYKVLELEIKQLIKEIKNGPKSRKNWKEIRLEVKQLITTLFPNSLSAQKIRAEIK